MCFTPEIDQRLKNTHEFWMCPFGHQQHFTEETAKEAELRYARRSRDMWRANYAHLLNEVYGCPFEDCNWRSHAGKARFWRSMLRHFSKTHGVDLQVTKPKLKAVS